MIGHFYPKVFRQLRVSSSSQNVPPLNIYQQLCIAHQIKSHYKRYPTSIKVHACSIHLTYLHHIHLAIHQSRDQCSHWWGDWYTVTECLCTMDETPIAFQYSLWHKDMPTCTCIVDTHWILMWMCIFISPCYGCSEGQQLLLTQGKTCSCSKLAVHL